MNATETSTSNPALAEAPMAAAPSDQLKAALSPFVGQVGTIKEVFPATYLASIVNSSMRNIVDTQAFLCYMQGVLAAVGNPQDPLLRQMIEQTTWMHVAAGELLVRASCDKVPEAAVALAGAATKLIAEHRRNTLAIIEARGNLPAATVPFTEAAVPTANVDPATDSAVPGHTPEKTYPNTKLGSKHKEKDHERTQREPHSAADCRPAQSTETPRPNASWPPTAQRPSPLQQALATLDGPPNSQRQSQVSSQWQSPPNEEHVRAGTSGSLFGYPELDSFDEEAAETIAESHRCE